MAIKPQGAVGGGRSRLDLGAVPFHVHGPWTHLSYEPDLGGVAQRLLGQQVGALAGGKGDGLGGRRRDGWGRGESGEPRQDERHRAWTRREWGETRREEPSREERRPVLPPAPPRTYYHASQRYRSCYDY